MSDPSVYRSRPEFVTVQGKTIAEALRHLAILLEEEGVASSEEINTLEIQRTDTGFFNQEISFQVSYVNPLKVWHHNSDGHYVEGG